MLNGWTEESPTWILFPFEAVDDLKHAARVM
jgi:hypothetical protein